MYTVLRQEREKRMWSQDYVAKQIGISREAVSMLETGAIKPSYDVLVKLLDLFEYSDPRILFGAATPDNTREPDGNQACKVNTHTE